MAGKSLTGASSLSCPHGGTVVITPSGKASAGGVGIVTASDAVSIAGCAFTLPGPTPSPCVQVQWVLPALRVKLNGAPALDEGSVGLCIGATGAPQGTVLVKSTQSSMQGQ